MSYKRIISVLLIISMAFCLSAPAFAAGAADRDEDGLDTFLSVLNAWGTFLARVTGSYGFFENMEVFSDFAHKWRDLANSDSFSPENLIALVLKWFGVEVFFGGEREGPEQNGDGSYTL